MRIDILSAVPSLLESPFSHSIVKRARDHGIVDLRLHDLHDHTENKHRKIDAPPYGGGAGMVLRVEPVANCIEALQKERRYDEIIYTTPEGASFDQKTATELATDQALIILCGHYKGIDERIRELFITREISVGDFVLSGGELPAAMIADAVIRLVPGVLGDETAAFTDSFQEGQLAPPLYTRPKEFRSRKVPDILLSGDHKKIEEWQEERAQEKTRTKRPDRDV